MIDANYASRSKGTSKSTKRVALNLITPVGSKKQLQWTHLQLISFAIAPVVLLLVVPSNTTLGGAIANESTVI